MPFLKISIFAAISWIVVVLLIAFVIRGRGPTRWAQLILIAFIIGPVGVLLAKFGSSFGLPWWMYYTIPMLCTVLLPPVYFRMRRSETVIYLVLSFLSSPIIHSVFALTLGWREYMPFMPWP